MPTSLIREFLGFEPPTPHELRRTPEGKISIEPEELRALLQEAAEKAAATALREMQGTETIGNVTIEASVPTELRPFIWETVSRLGGLPQPTRWRMVGGQALAESKGAQAYCSRPLNRELPALILLGDGYSERELVTSIVHEALHVFRPERTPGGFGEHEVQRRSRDLVAAWFGPELRRRWEAANPDYREPWQRSQS
jgi:hypothetical protein